MMPLTMVKTGEENTIKKVGGKEETRRFLENLGFVPGGEVTVVSEIDGNMIVNIKDSSVLNVISVSELFFQAKSAAGTYYRYFEVYFIIAVIYLILTLSVSAILRAVEKKMDGPDNYVIHGSQSDSRADIKVSVENEKEAVKRWNA